MGNYVSTWSAWNLDHRGFVEAAHQSGGAWFVRAHPSVKQVFASFWETNDLIVVARQCPATDDPSCLGRWRATIVSMDGVIAWKPPPWSPRTEGLHIDQHPVRLPDFECLQGMIPLYDVTPATGGLEVVPGSHRADLSAHVNENW